MLNDYREMQRVMGCECITENREIWGPELFAYSLAKSYGLDGWMEL